MVVVLFGVWMWDCGYFFDIFGVQVAGEVWCVFLVWEYEYRWAVVGALMGMDALDGLFQCGGEFVGLKF